MAGDAGARTYRIEELSLVGFLLLLFAGIVVFAFRVPFDARLFPLVIGTAGIGFCGFILVQSVWARASLRPPAGDPAVAATWPRFMLALLAAPVFGLLFWLFGFIVASIAAMLLMPPMMGYDNRRQTLIVGVTTVVLLAVLFPYLVGVSLPHGVVGDWLLDRFRQ